MTNKKKVNKKKSSSSKDVKAKKKEQQIKNKNKIDSVVGDDTNYKRIFWIVGIIAVVFGLFYILTVYIIGRDSNSTKKNAADSNVSVSYTDIIVGRSFSMPENEYLVLYYNQSDTDLVSSFSSLISNYRSDDNHFTFYVVDMNNAINKPYLSDQSNENPTRVSELAINGPTLIHFKNGSVVDYFEGVDDITDYLS